MLKRRTLFLISIFSLMQLNLIFAQISESKFNFGVKGGINYSLIGNQYSKYNGGASPTLGIFMSYKLGEHSTFVFEPAYSGIGFKQQQDETTYSMSCLDFSIYSFLYPSDISHDLAFVFGLRPSALIAHSTEAFLNGSTSIISDPNNQNINGQMDIGGVAGISLALSQSVNLELLYQHSLSNYNTSTTINGKPSTIEMGLRINAMGFQLKYNERLQKLQEQVNYFHKGVLLVMLPTPNQSQIKSLREQGKAELIPSIYDAFQTNNSIIMKEFSGEFTFCPVYFFMDTDAYKVVSGNTENIFVNRNMVKDPSIKIDSAHYFTASICNDVSTYTQRMQLGLFVYDDKLTQLPKPYNPNLFDFMNDGNPLNYINGRKIIIYNPNFIRKKIRKLNARLLNLLD